MLTEKRQEEIVRLVQERESITVAELKDILQTFGIHHSERHYFFG